MHTSDFRKQNGCTNCKRQMKQLYTLCVVDKWNTVHIAENKQNSSTHCRRQWVNNNILTQKDKKENFSREQQENEYIYTALGYVGKHFSICTLAYTSFHTLVCSVNLCINQGQTVTHFVDHWLAVEIVTVIMQQTLNYLGHSTNGVAPQLVLC